MNANDFISVFEYDDIQGKIKNKEHFIFSKTVKSNKNKYTINISGRWHTSWEQGCDDEVYHTFIDFDYSGAEIGRGGSGGAFDFLNFEELKNIINLHLKRFPDYTENEQLSFEL